MMKYNVTISERAEKNLDKIFGYLTDNWSKKIKDDFKNRLKKDVNHLRQNPYIYQESDIKKGIRRCIISRHNILYFKVNGAEVEIITIHNAMGDPDSLVL